jgi:4-hydroxybenzoate polyprenyltransferase
MTPLGPYARLVRLPNLPTALADITLAALALGAPPGRWPAFVLLLASSSCLYMGGMVFNDFFDADEDRRDRPDRPIPSGQITPRQAGWLGTGLLLGGLLLALLAGFVLSWSEHAGTFLGPLLVALPLAGAILLYDGLLKHTPLGPVVMGSCRFLNVLLGVTVSGGLAWPLGPHLAIVVGLYIVGVTWFARNEARRSDRTSLVLAATLMALALGLVLLVPGHLKDEEAPSPLFPYLLVVLGFFLGVPVWRAIQAPTPGNVQAAVKRALMCLILLDTVLATGTRAGTLGLVLLVLMIPSLYLNSRRWLYAT